MSHRDEVAGRIMVALDYPNAQAARELLQQLQGIPCYMKVGMQLYYAEGPAFVRELKELGYKVFLDLKLHDIPNTVKSGANSITKLGVDMINVHAAGGVEMMAAAMQGVNEAIEENPALDKPIVIAVTQLTSTSQDMLNQEIGIAGSVADSVVSYAKFTKQAGLDGVVASPLEVEMIKEACGSEFKTITPGIRPAGSALGDQTRVMTPKQAFEQGTDFVVIGRPITTAANPREAIENIIEELI
ncbi:orotidine-5'-phosphate decarboxylase [Paenibacillus guangzhouensis]|uniref:orotidine-5'-phosphate decarboxylase n=1 Tax=Paenibacillus guangzhouensis TaxID=1473112 RepID=UPI001266A111|nr:orotidine-5'-phosphate decarboxylase [Paenibacillus guangzhouensis]